MALAEALRTVRYGGAVAASGLTGGNDLATTVFPFIVRGVALLGIDTVATPIEERRALWADMAEAFPLERCEEMVNEEIGLDGLTAALDRVLDAAVRGRILVAPERSPVLIAGSAAVSGSAQASGVDRRHADRPVVARGDRQPERGRTLRSRPGQRSRSPSPRSGSSSPIPTGTSEYW